MSDNNLDLIHTGNVTSMAKTH